MIFLPYRMDSDKNGLPFFTVIICIICVIIFWGQYSKDALHYSAIEQFCYEELDRRDVSFLRNIVHEESGNHCSLIFASIREAADSKEKISELAKQAKPIGIFVSKTEDFKYISSHLEELFKEYNYKVPPNLTNNLAYNPKEIDLLKMATSTFSHGDIFHLLGNLLFFYIFAASVELIVGGFVYLVFIIVVTVVTSLAYSYAMYGVEEALPTIGLSGVVMAAVAALGVMIPSAKIRCFFWFFIYFKVFRIPAFFLAFWYIGWDVYEMNQFGNDSYINYVAHVSGAGVGVLLGVFYVLFRKDTLRMSAVSY